MKNLKIMSVLLGGLLALGSFPSCSSDDEPEVPKAASAKVEYVLNLSQDLLSACTVTVYYIDSDGQQVQETVMSSPWAKTVTFATLPANAGFSVQPMLKGEPSQEEYDIEADGKMTVTMLDQKGNAIGIPFVGSTQAVKGQLGPDYLGQYLTRISTRLFEAKAIAADGTIGDATITWGGNADDNDPNRDTEVTNDGATGTTRG
jgi:hypothetical protein